MSIVQTHLSDRAVVQLSGSDRVDFLQNLVTQNVAQIPQGGCVMAALLTPQGKLLHDFLIHAENDCFYIDCAAAQAEALSKRLAMYKLRADVSLSMTDLQVYALWQEDGYPCPPMAGFVEDPRHEGLGLRGMFEAAPDVALPQQDVSAWQHNRLRLGIPQGPDEMPPGTVFPLEFGLQHIQAVDFQKGCFVGQEVTSRTHRKGRLRKSLRVIDIVGSAQSGDEISAEARIVGHIVAVDAAGAGGLALIREDAMDSALRTEQAEIRAVGGLFDAPASA